MQTTTNSIAEDFTFVESIPKEDRNTMPVIRIDLNGKILFANEASLLFLNEVLRASKEYIPVDFINKIPGMLNLNADFSMPVEGASQTILFDVIGFEECGYIGLYGYASSDLQKASNVN